VLCNNSQEHFLYPSKIPQLNLFWHSTKKKDVIGRSNPSRGMSVCCTGTSNMKRKKMRFGTCNVSPCPASKWGRGHRLTCRAGRRPTGGADRESQLMPELSHPGRSHREPSSVGQSGGAGNGSEVGEDRQPGHSVPG